MDDDIKTIQVLRDAANAGGAIGGGSFLEELRIKLTHVKLFLEMVQDKETAPSSEWVANRAKELLA